MTNNISRRAFLKNVASSAAVLVVGFNHEGVLAVAGNDSVVINPFVSIGQNGLVTVIAKHFEMGQGTTTGLATLVAEELDADWAKVAVDFAPADHEKYKNLLTGLQGTGGSNAIANAFMQYREAGAAARELLVRAAAADWGVPQDSIEIVDSKLRAGKREGHFGEFLATANTLMPSANPKLKNPCDFKLIGNQELPRKDSSAKTDGSAVFAMDVTLPGMVYAAVLRSPRFGGTLVSFNASEAAKMGGFLDAKALPNKAGVVIYARNTWAAFQARNAIKAEWDFSSAEVRSTGEMIEEHRQLADSPQFNIRPFTTEAAVKGIEKAASTIDAEFVFPHLAHAPMETLNCVIEPTANGVLIHDGCQMPGLVTGAVGQVLGLKPEQVEIKTVYAGGGFGRRVTPTSDYQVEAAMALMLLGGKTPVKLVWSREDDLHGGYYRAMALHRAKIGLDDQGKILGWDHRLATQSIMKGTFMEPYIKDGIDLMSVEGCGDTLYNLPTMALGLSDFPTQVSALWWRSVGNSHTAFAMECLLDMVAHHTGQDPIELRLDLLDKSQAPQRRMANVIETVRKTSGWKKGQKRGFAAHYSFKTCVAVVADLSVEDKRVHVDKLYIAVDCGVPVNPDVIRAQMEGGAGFALGAITGSEITFSEGEVVQSNFPDYPSLRMPAMPAVEVSIIPSAEPPSGVGEPAVPPTGPAVANALFAMTGQRVTQLPLSKSGFIFI